jgi:hypothetical protein
LLALPAVEKESLPEPIQRYLRLGEINGVADRYKCRKRKFWYVVPNVRVADAFLSYMSGEMPYFVSNPADLVAPNTVHVVRFLNGYNSSSVAAAWRNSLTKLSCELEGHALGGGLFKLEPSEAERILVVAPRAAHKRALLEYFDRCPTGSMERGLNLSDRYLLREVIGLSEAECNSLRQAAMRIEQWRKHQ